MGASTHIAYHTPGRDYAAGVCAGHTGSQSESVVRVTCGAIAVDVADLLAALCIGHTRYAYEVVPVSEYWIIVVLALDGRVLVPAPGCPCDVGFAQPTHTVGGIQEVDVVACRALDEVVALVAAQTASRATISGVSAGYAQVGDEDAAAAFDAGGPVHTDLAVGGAL